MESLIHTHHCYNRCWKTFLSWPNAVHILPEHVIYFFEFLPRKAKVFYSKRCYGWGMHYGFQSLVLSNIRVLTKKFCAWITLLKHVIFCIYLLQSIAGSPRYFWCWLWLWNLGDNGWRWLWRGRRRWICGWRRRRCRKKVLTAQNDCIYFDVHIEMTAVTVFSSGLINFIFADQGPRKQLAKKQLRNLFSKFMSQVNWKGDISLILIMR